MKKIIYLFLTVISISSCNDTPLVLENPYEDVDYEVLAQEDDVKIVEFLSTHYYNERLDSIKLVENGELSLLNDTDNLKIEELTNTINNKVITFKLYTYVIDKGFEAKGKPTNIDSLLVNYSGRILNSENTLNATEFDSNTTTWIKTGILGWSYGFTNFSPAEQNYVFGEKISFDHPGRGFIFIPGGLAYPSDKFVPGYTSQNLLLDQTLVFKVDLLSYKEDTDHDNDGVPSILEDPDCDRNPRNNFSDKNTPTLPDFLNPNISESYNCYI